MKRLLCLIMVLCLVGCQSKEPIIIRNDYIEPINEVNFYDILNDKEKDKLALIYNEEKPNNNLFEMLGKLITDLELQDYNDNTISFADYFDSNIVLEVVQNTCEHCKKQVALTETILANEDVTFIQYFAWGTKEEIDQFYKEAGFSIPDKLIVIPHADEMSDYISRLNVDSTPTFIFFRNGKVSLAYTGELSYAKYQNVINFLDNNEFSKNSLLTNDGQPVFELYRGYNDVYNSLSNDNKDKLAKIENSEEVTVNCIGKNVSLNELYEAEEESLYHIDYYNKYINKPLVVFYVGYLKDNLEKDIKNINEFVANHKDLNVLAILMDTKDIQTSSLYKDIDIKLNCDVVSSNSEVPKQLLDATVVTYPAALFIQDNKFTGGFNDFKTSEEIETAYNTFIGNESIALITNN